ncbi:maker114 [Drosophila busckii]|uniref:Maker114 n=1 Tax=Drosophila busckii TaxID=30019 RepID=A0A0M5IY08_DROBS|nr:maker114 [Drosophila busckii]
MEIAIIAIYAPPKIQLRCQ